MKVKDRYWEAENSIRFANPEKTTRPLLCEPKVSEDGVRIRLWLRNLAEGTGAGGAIVLLSRHEAAVMANAINTRSNWIGEKTSDMPRIGVSPLLRPLPPRLRPPAPKKRPRCRCIPSRRR